MEQSMKINLKLLEKIKKHIEEEPRRFDMDTWGVKHDMRKYRNEDTPPCGTSACLAGWAVLLSTPKKSSWGKIIEGWWGEAPDKKAAKLMGIPLDQCPFYFQSNQYAKEWLDSKIAEARKA
jgi:hypothetical protein